VCECVFVCTSARGARARIFLTFTLGYPRISCVLVCVCVHTRMLARTYTHATPLAHACTRTKCTSPERLHARAHTCKQARTHAHTHTHTHTYTQMYACSSCERAHTHANTRARARTHTHTLSLSLSLSLLLSLSLSPSLSHVLMNNCSTCKV
jgi:ABC-type nickel/cobalt efflux system permease component RcnA